MGQEALYVATEYFVEIIKSPVKYTKCDIKLPVHASSLDTCWAVQMSTTEVVFFNTLWHVMKRTEVWGQLLMN